MHDALSVIDLTRHPEIWHSSFREDKGQDFQVSYFLYQQYQLTCSECLLPHDQKSAEGLGKRNSVGRGLNMLFSGGFQARWALKTFLSLRMEPLHLAILFQMQFFMKPTATTLFKITTHSPIPNLLTLFYFYCLFLMYKY